MRYFLSVLFILLSASVSFTQPTFTGVNNSSLSATQFSTEINGAQGIAENPAVLGFYHATNLWYNTLITDGEFSEQNFYVQSPFLFMSFGANFRSALDDEKKKSAHLYGFGFGAGSDKFALGYNTVYFVYEDKEATLQNFGCIYRPQHFLSFAYVLKNFNEPDKLFPSTQTFGIGFSPSPFPATVFLDWSGKRNSPIEQYSLQSGVKIRATKSLTCLFAYHEKYNASSSLLVIGIQFSFPNSSLHTALISESNAQPELSFGVQLKSDDERD